MRKIIFLCILGIFLSAQEEQNLNTPSDQLQNPEPNIELPAEQLQQPIEEQNFDIPPSDPIPTPEFQTPEFNIEIPSEELQQPMENIPNELPEEMQSIPQDQNLQDDFIPNESIDAFPNDPAEQIQEEMLPPPSNQPQEASQQNFNDQNPQNLSHQTPDDQNSQTQQNSSSEAPAPSPAPLTQQPNPNANPISPDFFELNKKNPPREAMRSIGPKELREKIQQCEENEDKNTCFDVGMIYYQGRSIYGQQLKHALYFFDRSCDEKAGLGCYEAGVIGSNFKQYQYAFIFFEKSCQSGDLRGCKNLGVLYYNGWGSPKNAHRATELFNFGCKSGDQSSCQKLYLALGDAYKESRNFVGAKKNYQKGCELGDEQSCKQAEVMELLQQELYRQNAFPGNAKRKP